MNQLQHELAEERRHREAMEDELETLRQMLQLALAGKQKDELPRKGELPVI
eukprot:COSAG02_NODE_144_length_34086_cov_65.390944_40_plen_51_part_00